MEDAIAIDTAVGLLGLLVVDPDRDDHVLPVVKSAGDVDQRDCGAILVADVQACAVNRG